MRDRQSSGGRWSRRNSSGRSRRRKRSRIGSAATRQEAKVLPAARAVSPGRWGEVGGSLGRFGVCPTGLSLDAPAGIGSGGRSAATSAVMVVGGGGPSRGGKSCEKLTLICLDVSVAPRDLCSGHRP